MSVDLTNLVIIGGGPGGVAPLLAAHRRGRLAELLEAGITIVERGDSLGAGAIGDWCINSDSTGFTFADCLAGPHDGELAALREHPLTKEMGEAAQGTVNLRRAGEFLGVVGKAVYELVAASPRGQVLTRHHAISVRQTEFGWETLVEYEQTGFQRILKSRNLLLATGAWQPYERMRKEEVAGVNLVERYGDKLLQSGDVISHQGFVDLTARLAGLGRSPRLVIIGGSTSAASVACAMLTRMPQVKWGSAGVTLMHRHELRIYYPTVEAALKDNYTEFGPDDICPLTGRVFRLAGFRMDSRELIMSARAIGGRPPEPRLQLHRLDRDNAATLALLDQADVIVTCFGYRPRALPVLDQQGNRVVLHSETSPHAPLVDGACRVMDASGTPLPNLYGMGLAAGFVPHGKLGGERSFRGQANGLWLWQSDVGGMIVDAVLSPRPTEQYSVTPEELSRYYEVGEPQRA
jgi:hypothetical protein